MRNPILYQNADRTVTLIDIPVSIAAAQSTAECPGSDNLVSCAALQEPHQIINEPKSAKAKENALANTVDGDSHEVYSALIGGALQTIKNNVSDEWCLPRRTPADIPSRVHAAHSAERPNLAQTSQSAELEALLPALCGTNAVEGLAFPAYLSRIDILHAGSGATSSRFATPRSGEDWEPWDCVFHNDRKIPLQISIKKLLETAESSTVHRFRIPPRSSFVLGDCSRPKEFHHAFQSITEEYGISPRFDFILIDPPWPNTSAKRRGGYGTHQTLKVARKVLLDMKLDALIAEQGLVGIWITNKPAVRSLMLGPKGLLNDLGLRLEEEWIWLKVTSKGEPTSALDSAWKKPYEVLLLARALGNASVSKEVAEQVKRRVVVAVPDLHSRKPCLKELVEQLLPRSTSYAALEIFARHLVSGWWSWGNEVLRFNSEESWIKAGT